MAHDWPGWVGARMVGERYPDRRNETETEIDLNGLDEGDVVALEEDLACCRGVSYLQVFGRIQPYPAASASPPLCL